MNHLNKIENFYNIKIEKIPQNAIIVFEGSESISSLLPPFKKYTKNDIKFKEFKPLTNNFYLFFSENYEPTYSIINRTYNKLY